MDYAKESLKMHYELRGKLEVTSRAAVDTKDALSLARSEERRVGKECRL